MDKKLIIEKLEGIIEVTKGCISVTGSDEWNNPWMEEIEALNNAIKAVKENEKLQVKVTKALNALVKELEKKTKPIENLREELHEHIDSFGINDTRTIEKSQELDKEIEIEQLKREVVYFMKRSVQAERLLSENECFCPVLQRNEIRDFLRS